jgi:ketosteroid isomerase-like protein
MATDSALHPDERGKTMSTEDNVKTVTSVYEAFGRGDIAAVVEVLADDVDWSAEAASTDVPWWGPRHGKAEVVSFFEALGGAMETTEFTPLVVMGDGDDVLTVVRYGARSRTNGRTATMELHHHWKLRDGKITHYRGAEDTLQTLQVFRG